MPSLIPSYGEGKKHQKRRRFEHFFLRAPCFSGSERTFSRTEFSLCTAGKKSAPILARGPRKRGAQGKKSNRRSFFGIFCPPGGAPTPPGAPGGAPEAPGRGPGPPPRGVPGPCFGPKIGPRGPLEALREPLQGPKSGVKKVGKYALNGPKNGSFFHALGALSIGIPTQNGPQTCKKRRFLGHFRALWGPVLSGVSMKIEWKRALRTPFFCPFRALFSTHFHTNSTQN